MSEENKVESEAGEPELGSTDIVEEETVEEDSVVLSYPDRVPNSKRGVDYKHCYVMIGFVIVFLLFSLIISNFTSSY